MQKIISQAIISSENELFNNLKILMDGIFGSNNFIGQVVWEKRYANQNTEKYISTNHEYILIYKKKVLNIRNFF